MDERVSRPEEAWDRFIDALDRAGQAGSAAEVRVPMSAAQALGGKAFGELSRDDVKQLSRVASALGRRADTIVTIWDDMQRRARRLLKAPKKRQRR
jgi:hypothetical protein